MKRQKLGWSKARGAGGGEDLGRARSLADRARAVLDANWLGHATKPGPHLYPHQWSWDAGFVAIGYATYAPERGWQELRSLFAGQWRSGLLPHIVFHPGTGAYFPGPEAWRTDLAAFAPASPRTSGIIQPPLHATAARRLYEATGDPAFALEELEALLPALVAWHEYLYRDRDPEGDGLVAIRHPWESGQDDSPAWDEPLTSVPHADLGAPPYRRVDLTMVTADERPTQAEYDDYMALMECFKAARYDEGAIRVRCPFLVEEVLVNTLLAEANEDLAALLDEHGDDGRRFREHAARTRAAMERRLWSERLGSYLPYDRREGRLIRTGAVAGIAPLFAGVPSGRRARVLLGRLDSPRFWRAGGPGFGVPSYDRLAPGFSPRRYWRGPVWVNTNWLLIRGLRRYGFHAYAEALRASTLELVERSGFAEYFDPETGEGLGSDSFSWTAALVLDLLRG